MLEAAELFEGPFVSVASALSAKVDLVGELTIVKSEDLRSKILSAFDEVGSVLVSFDPKSPVDLTFVQLMESARRTAREDGRGLSLAAPAGGPLREALERGGFRSAPADRAFWLLEEEA